MSDTPHALLAASTEILLLVDPQSLAIVDINAYACTQLGRPREDLIGQPVTEIECALQDIFYWDEVRNGHFRPLAGAVGLYACARGDFLPVEKTVVQLTGQTPAYIAICARDARESASVEQALARVSSTLQATFESTGEGFLVTDRDQQILNYNARFLQAFGVSIDGTDSAAHARLLQRIADQTTAPASATRRLHEAFQPDGGDLAFTLTLCDDRCIQVRSRPLLMNDQVEGRVVSVDDITERIRHEQELAAARDAAAASAKAKADFLAMMSHEIRTPLTGILGMTELLLDTAISPTQRDYLDMAHQSAEGLLTVINDILDFSRIEAGRMSVETIDFDLAATLAAAAGPLAWQAHQRGINFRLAGVTASPVWVRGDPARIRQILINLTGNAIKFTESGGVTVTLEHRQTGGQVAVRLAVHDTGIGIPADQLALIFEAFSQSDSSISRRFGGTGLGLAISSRLATLMGGRIEVTSRPGQGSCFTLVLDLPIAAETPRPPAIETSPAVPDRGGLAVLLAEDTPVNQVFISSILRKAGHQVTIAGDGAEAVRVALAGRTAGTPFDVILMDIQMPVMDGFSATRALREAGVDCPVIALTAHVADGFGEDCLRRGMTGYLPKPLKSDLLLARLAELRPTSGMPASAATGTPAPAPGNDPVLDTATAIDLLDGDHEVYASLLELAAVQIQDDLTTLLRQVADSDIAAVGACAHRLKGSLGTIGATRAQHACRALEIAAKTDPPPDLRSLVDAVEHAIHELAGVLPGRMADLEHPTDHKAPS